MFDSLEDLKDQLTQVYQSRPGGRFNTKKMKAHNKLIVRLENKIAELEGR
jgi:hypothetical protein